MFLLMSCDVRRRFGANQTTQPPTNSLMEVNIAMIVVAGISGSNQSVTLEISQGGVFS